MDFRTSNVLECHYFHVCHAILTATVHVLASIWGGQGNMTFDLYLVVSFLDMEYPFPVMAVADVHTILLKHKCMLSIV